MLPLFPIFTFTLILLVALAAFIGASRWRSATREVRARLRASRETVAPPRYDRSELEGLPPPVRRYLEAVLPEGTPLLQGARIRHKGEFNMDVVEERWARLTSDQLVSTRRPGFDWDARVSPVPGARIFVRDGYVAGEGRLRACMLGLFVLAEGHPSPEMNRGELMRWLAEAVWYPTALLPSQGVAWTALDERSARATILDGETEASLDFRFREDGLVDSVYAAARPRSVKGRFTDTPWEGRFSDYQEIGDLRIPMQGEVGWHLSEGLRPYWRGRITSIEHEAAGPGEPAAS